MHARTAPQLLLCLAACAASMPCPAQPAEAGPPIVVRTSARTAAQVVDAIKAHAEANKWVYMGAQTVRPAQGDVTLVKICIPQVGAAAWQAGLHMSALLPCGNVGVYEIAGITEVAMLHPRYMPALYPHAATAKAAEIAAPLLLDMLERVTR